MIITRKYNRLTHVPGTFYVVQIGIMIKVPPAYLQDEFFFDVSAFCDKFKLCSQFVRCKSTNPLFSQLNTPSLRLCFASVTSSFVRCSRLHPLMQQRVKIHTAPIIFNTDPALNRAGNLTQ